MTLHLVPPRTVNGLRTGISWLAETVQPDGCMPSHLGEVFSDRRQISFVPKSGNALGIVIAISIIKPRYDDNYVLLTPFDDGELDAYADALLRLGHTVIDQWNGNPGAETASFQIGTQTHPSYLAGLKLYNAGCPEHRTVFCGRAHSCPWWEDGYAQVIKPVWPSVTLIGG